MVTIVTKNQVDMFNDSEVGVVSNPWSLEGLNFDQRLEVIERFGRKRLSKNFMMRDFMYLSRAQAMNNDNFPEDDPEHVLECGRALCEKVLEPIYERFGKFSISYGYSNRTCMDATVEPSKRGTASSRPHHWDRGTFGKRIYARVDIIPYCVVDGEVSKQEFGEWCMMNLDLDMLMQWDKSCALCITISPKPRRVWCTWVPYGKGEGGANKITHWGEKFWQEDYYKLPSDKKPKYGPSETGGRMWWPK